jgi:hypothetical protein
MMVMGRIEAWKNKWGFSYDTVYLNLGYDDGFKGIISGIDYDLGIDARVWMNDFAVHYRLIDEPIGNDSGQRFTFEPYGGFRYMYLKQETSLDKNIPGVGSTGETIGGSEDWVEPMVGGRIFWMLDDEFSFYLRGDAGGFGVGSASKLSWNIMPGFTCKLSENTTFDFGYRIFDMDYNRGSGTNTFGLDAKAYGPVLGLTVKY